MANVDNPFGFRPIRRGGASYVSGGGNVYAVPGSATVIAPGDLVVRNGNSDANAIPFVVAATDDDARVTGVCLGVTNSPTPSLQGSSSDSVTFDTPLNTIVTSSVQYILVEDDPQVTYVAQTAVTLILDDIGNTFRFVPGTSTTDGKSIYEIGALVGTAVAPIRMLRMQQIQGNEVGLNSIVEVMLNATTEANNVSGA